MTTEFRPATGWGPGKQRAALALTFDNFGEALQLELGKWEGKVGSHPTAAFLPRLMELLGETKATYFMEGSNAAIYPDVIQKWQAAGHEVGLHGWRHEFWFECPAERRRANLAASVKAMRDIGVETVGFRPPGGGMRPEAWGELEEAGLRYCSPLGSMGPSRVQKLVSLPFEWRAVDAFMLEDVLGPLRVKFGHPEASYSVTEWSANLDEILKQLVASGGQRTIIFHPEYLCENGDKLAALFGFLESARRQNVWVAPAREVAAFVAAQVDVPLQEVA